ncbi:MAG: DUF4019 domain-containing protein [Desulfuromusa sp.]|nr:DUF4019 domain-containing protein [Desulfuromusa sp.]
METRSLPILPLSVICTLLLLAITPTFCFAEQQTDLTAIVAAEKFVQTLDKSDFLAAWNQTDLVNQSYTDHPEWFKKILAVRPHLGQVLNRSLEKLSHHASWVGLPDRDYLRVSFTTVFLNKADSLETVVLVKEQGIWRVSSFHLR